ncbi:unnamed protein product [Allacma fusca]|uniref:RING-type E3 ubiquitin transferase n=1 Tax=Allacma fusca TaxID=39272 RepID=A0A8J2NXI4_9HEXA|nr:unnamed protein product [Allacma fusca]
MTRYFCHSCRKMMAHINADYTCPFCEKGFIEESATDLSQEELPPAQLDFFRLFNFGPPMPSSSSHYSWPNHRDPQPSSLGSSASSTNQGYRRPFIENSTDNMLYSFISDLVMGLGGGHYGSGFPLAANFGDYVWGRDGLDALVTQLMNNMEGTGPPPLDNDKLIKLPNITIGRVHVDAKLQCSVCWDDFSMDEQVKQLQCEHLYHQDCIVPWLKLHGTCPVCRKDLNEADNQGVREANSSDNNSTTEPSTRCNVEMDFD